MTVTGANGAPAAIIFGDPVGLAVATLNTMDGAMRVKAGIGRHGETLVIFASIAAFWVLDLCSSHVMTCRSSGRCSRYLNLSNSNLDHDIKSHSWIAGLVVTLGTAGVASRIVWARNRTRLRTDEGHVFLNGERARRLWDATGCHPCNSEQ